MDSTRLVFLVAVFIANAAPTLGGGFNVGEDDWWRRKLSESYNRSLLHHHKDPISEVKRFNLHVHRALKAKNSTRRALQEEPRLQGPCEATNPIDQCWRCKEDWAQNRKLLADCGMGFGRLTTGGKDGEFYEVTDPTDDDVIEPKPGTLRFGVLQARPLWITFARDMNIKLKMELMVTSNKTIDGRGARIQIEHGCGISIQFAQNVIIHNIKIHDIVPSQGGMIRDTADHVGIRQADDGDAISIFASSRVWLDHLSLSSCKDGLVDVVSGSTAATISNCHLTKHDDVMLFGASDKEESDRVIQVTVAFNHFGRELVQRMPRCRWGFFHVVNNDYTHWLMYAIGGTSDPTIISNGNRFLAPPEPRYKEITFRNNAVDDREWKNWVWKSENDLLLDGAFFTESGQPFQNKFDPKDFFKAYPGIEVSKLTRNSGHLKCIPGQKC